MSHVEQPEVRSSYRFHHRDLSLQQGKIMYWKKHVLSARKATQIGFTQSKKKRKEGKPHVSSFTHYSAQLFQILRLFLKFLKKLPAAF